jgi:hypothetical protein
MFNPSNINNMKKLFLSIAIVFAFAAVSKLDAQVTIGANTTPDANAILDLQSNTNKGLLMPRVALTATNNPAPTSAHTAGMTVYNTATTSANNGYDVSPGFYYNDGTKWVRMPLGYTNWFYMPSISFDTSTSGTGRTKDLYALYYGQFHAPSVKSTGAPTSVPYIPAATDFYYYITAYDGTVFSNITINASGLMTYDVIDSATDCSYINILFVLK